MEKQEVVVKDFTTIEQSKVLSEFLPHETANMVYCYTKEGDKLISPMPIHLTSTPTNTFKYLHCWSLAALLNVLPTTIGNFFEKNALRLRMDKGENDFNIWYENFDCSDVAEGLDVKEVNPIDTCYEMIIKLHEQKLL